MSQSITPEKHFQFFLVVRIFPLKECRYQDHFLFSNKNLKKINILLKEMHSPNFL